MDEDELGDFLGLPSGIGTTAVPSQTVEHLPPNTKQKDVYCELYGAVSEKTEKNEEAVDSGYNDLFGEESNTPSIEFKKLDVQTSCSLGHEPLFPDVDETKIKPSVSLGSLQPKNNIRVTTPQKEEFTIVLDPSSSDPRLNASGNVPVADWVVQTGPGRREPALMRQNATPMRSTTPPSRSGGLHPPSGMPMGHHGGRNMGGSSGGSRTVRIPPGCNPELEPEFPTRAAPDQALKLPGQTRVTPDEYKEFLGLGHGEIFNLDLDRVIDPPWRAPGVDASDFFNYGLDETTWKDYCKAIECHRQEFSMKKKIQTYESSNVHYQQDPDLPPEVAAAIAAESYQARPGTGPDMSKALPIPVFQGADDYSLRNRRGRDFRRPEVRYDTEVIVELAGGIEPSTGVNTDYGEDYVGSFGPGDLKPPVMRSVEKSVQGSGTQSVPIGRTAEDSPANKAGGESQSEASKKQNPKEEELAIFREEDEFNDPRSRSEMMRPGELAMGMDAADQPQDAQPWPSMRMSHPGSGAPGRPEFGRMYDPYAPPQDMWRPLYPGRPWRPRGGPYERGPPDYWATGRGYGRPHHPDGSRGAGRYWSPYGTPRRPGRRPPPPRYYEDYPTTQAHHYPTWPRRDERPPPMPHHRDHHLHQENEPKDTSTLETPVSEEFHPVEHSSSYRERDKRRYSGDMHEDDRLRSYPRSHSKEYDADVRPPSHHRDRGRDHGRSHRREEYAERHRDRRKRDKSAERDARRRAYSRERCRPRDRDERKSRRYETSESDSESRYRNRSRDRDERRE